MNSLTDFIEMASATRNKSLDYIDLICQTQEEIKVIQPNRDEKRKTCNHSFFFLEMCLLRSMIISAISPTEDYSYDANKLTNLFNRIDPQYCKRICFLYAGIFRNILNNSDFLDRELSFDDVISNDLSDLINMDQEQEKELYTYIAQVIVNSNDFYNLIEDIKKDVIENDEDNWYDYYFKDFSLSKIDNEIISLLESNYIKDICNVTVYFTLFKDFENYDKLYFLESVDIAGEIIENRKKNINKKKMIIDDEMGYKREILFDDYMDLLGD